MLANNCSRPSRSRWSASRYAERRRSSVHGAKGRRECSAESRTQSVFFVLLFSSLLFAHISYAMARRASKVESESSDPTCV